MPREAGRPRKYPLLKAGDVIGSLTVIAALPATPSGRERARWRCACGVEGVSLVWNMRKRVPTCTHDKRTSPSGCDVQGTK